METLRLTIGQEDFEAADPAISECAAIIRRGGLVAMPTETVYGLAANALDPTAVERIFEAKDRPSWDPLIVHVSSLEMISRVASDFPQQAQILGERFWPGPLTLLLPRSRQLPPTVTANRDTVAVRMPEHPVARALIAAANLPLAAPSANRFGRISPTTADHVLRDLDGRIEAVLDAGPTNIGLESTIIDALCTPALILRPGGITREQVEAVIGSVEIYSPSPDQPPGALASPGLATRHYAPTAKLLLVEGTREALLQAVQKHVASEGDRGSYVGVMAPDQWLGEKALSGGGMVLFDWGVWKDWPQLARNLFVGLRSLDKPGVSVILCPLPPEEGIGLALRDRLMRAAAES
ncbi:MAG TPA: L-threonylcarbamoyladenylate synthase [Terriglobales bacterium]|nr:L-threonylcarbamoyladenylate synthase [Terriglobales bacterium]